MRAFAVLAVIFYHMGLGWAPGGLMGVTVFFVISGYLINGLLVGEYETTGTVSLSQFWLRRVRRIIPAVILALAGTLVLCALVSPNLFAKARTDLIPSLFFFNNWWQIFHNVSYFEAAAAPSPLTHYWSLAIEEQFYIVWPLLLLALCKLKVPKPAIAAIVGVLAVLSFGEMAYLYNPMSDPSRIYYGTDTRAGSLLIGAFLALVWPSTIFGHRRAQSKAPGARLAFNVAGVVALVGLVVIVAFTNSYTPFPYLGGIALVSALTALLIAALVVPNTWVARLMQLEPLVWIGKRSYGMYLWHYPIILATTKLTSTVEVPWWARVAQLIIIFAVSDLSFRFVETPIRSGALRRWWDNRGKSANQAAASSELPSDSHGRHTSKRISSAITVGVCATLVCTSVVALAVMPPLSTSVPQPASQTVSSSGDAKGSPSAETPADSSASQAGTASSQASTASSQASTSSSGEASATSNAATSSGSGETVSSSASGSTASSSAAETSSSASVAVATQTADSTTSSASVQSAQSAEASQSASSQAAASESAAAANSTASSGSSGADSPQSSPAASEASASVAASPSSSSGNATQLQASPPTASNTEASESASAQSASSSASGEAEAAGSSASADQGNSSTLFVETQAAIAERVANLTDEEKAKAQEAARGPVENAVITIDDQIKVCIEQAEQQRKQSAYNEVFGEGHLNSSGAIIYDPLLIGDSVSAGCENEFYKAFPNGHCDAQVNRNVWESPYQFYADNDQVGNYVVFCLGTNNAVIDQQIDELLAPVPGDKKVILVNIRCPRDWEAQTNKAIADAPKRHPIVVAVVDWYGASAGHDEYFYEDGIHVNGAGAKAYIDLIKKAIEDTL